MIASGVTELSGVVGMRAACAARAVSRATHYRRTAGRRLGPPAPRPRPARALTETERTTVLDLLHSDRFVDVAPGAVVATLLDEGTYHASERTLYRIPGPVSNRISGSALWRGRSSTTRRRRLVYEPVYPYPSRSSR